MNIITLTIRFVCACFFHSFCACNIKNLSQYDRPRVLGCQPEDGVLDILGWNTDKVTLYYLWFKLIKYCYGCSPDGRCVCLPSGEQSDNICLIWTSTTSTPSTYSHPSTLGLSY